MNAVVSNELLARRAAMQDLQSNLQVSGAGGGGGQEGGEGKVGHGVLYPVVCSLQFNSGSCGSVALLATCSKFFFLFVCGRFSPEAWLQQQGLGQYGPQLAAWCRDMGAASLEARDLLSTPDLGGQA